MKNSAKKVISVLLVVIMLLTVAPLSGFVGIELPEIPWKAVFTPKAKAATSDTCGENLTWTLDDEGTLTISGTGAMFDFSFMTSPWYDSLESIKKIVINDDVTTIGNYAFGHFQNLVSVKIPESVISIGDYAFCFCDSLADVTIHDGIISIGEDAFIDCDSLVSIYIPESVTSIGYRAFDGCDSLLEINVDEDNEYYFSDDGVLFDNSKSTLIQYPSGKTDSSYDIPDGVTCIAAESFSSADMSDVSIPDSVTEIGYFAFAGCSAIKNIFIPDSVTEIDTGAFTGCSSLENVTFAESIRLDFIHGRTFDGCYSLKSINIPDSVISLGFYAFGSCSSLESLELPDGLTNIGQRAFAYCNSLTTINIPAGFRELDEYAFADSAFTSITVDSNSEHYAAKDGVLFNKNFTQLVHYPNNKAGDSYVVPDSVTAISNYAFANENLTSITLPYSVTTVEEDTFSECFALTKLVFANPDCKFSYIYYTESLPSTVTIYGYENSKAQYYAEQLGLAFEIFVCEHTEKQSMDAAAATCISDGHEAGVFCRVCGVNVEGLEVIPATNPSVGCVDKNDDDKCDFCSDEWDLVEYGNCGENLTWKLYSNGLLRIFGTGDMWDYSQVGQEGTMGSYQTYSSAPWAGLVRRLSVKNVIIEDGVTCLSANSFYCCKNIESVYIAGSVTRIGMTAFNMCESLKKINFSQNSKLKIIEAAAFATCPLIDSIVFPDSVTEIGMSAFAYCDSLSEVSIPDSVISIGKNAFYDCPLTSITVAANNKIYSSENGVLYDKDKKQLIIYPMMKEDTSFSIPETVTSIADNAFVRNKNLISVFIPSAVSSSGKSTFYDCDSLKNVTFAENSKLQTIGESMFAYCGKLEKIVIPYGVEIIEERAFICCYSLTDITIPDSVINIGENAFESCYELKNITVPYSVKFLSADAFDYYNLNQIVIANPDCEIDDGYFDYDAEYCDVVIYGYENSTAQNFAQNYDVPFEIFECDHSDKRNYSALPPTCTKEGRTEGVGCPVCGLCYEGLETVPALNPSVGCVDKDMNDICDLCNRSFIVLFNGVCGDNIVWKVTDDCQMFISGTGAMWDYDLMKLFSYVMLPPWTENGLNMVVDTITISEGITHIGDGSFYYFVNLREINLPDTLVSIGDAAFVGCSSLSEVIFPDNVTDIGMMAFAECSSLESVYIGNGIQLSDLFTTLFISGDFDNLKNIVADEDNPYWTVEDGVLYNKEKTVLYFYPGSKTQSSFSVPQGVETIFANAFTHCSALTSISIPDSVTSISATFDTCENLTDIIVDENNEAYLSIDGVLYSKDKKLLVCYPSGKTEKSYRIPDGVTLISNNAFAFCESLETVIIPDSMKHIGYQAFFNCTSLANIEFSENTQLESIGTYAFKGTSFFDNSDNWTDGVLYLDNYLVATNYSINNGFYYVKDGTLVIADSAFESLGSLSGVFIPASVTNIGTNAFPCYSGNVFSNITVDENNTNYSSVDGVLYNKDQTELICYPFAKTDSSFIVPGSVRSVATGAFRNSTKLMNITVGDNVEHIGAYAFDGSGYYNDMSNWSNDMLYIGNHLVATAVNLFGLSSVSGDCVIREGTRTIADQLFVYAFDLTSVTFPESCTHIGEVLLLFCFDLESVTVLNPDCVIGDSSIYAAQYSVPIENLVIYGYSNSTAEDYADRFTIEFIALDAPQECVHEFSDVWIIFEEPSVGIPGKEYRECTHCDYRDEREIPALQLSVSDEEDSKISISDTDGVFRPEDGNVTASIIKDTQQAQYILTDINKMSAWNITFYNENGEEIQPEAPVTVRMPIPEDYNLEDLLVMHLDPITNDATIIPHTIEDGYAVFKASSFSVYVLVDASSVGEEEPDDSCSHICHKDNILGLLWKIINFFNKLFNVNPVCECGTAHY